MTMLILFASIIVYNFFNNDKDIIQTQSSTEHKTQIDAIEKAYLVLMPLIISGIAALLTGNNLFNIFILCLKPICRTWTIKSEYSKTQVKILLEYITKNCLFAYNYTIVKEKSQPCGFILTYNKSSNNYIYKFNICYVKTTSTIVHRNQEIRSEIIWFGNIPDCCIMNTFGGQENILKNEETEKITMYTRGNYFGDDFYKYDLEMPNIIPTQEQKMIISNVRDIYSKQNYCRTVISGKPGIGKSTVCKLLARELKASLCFDLDITSPGNDIMVLYKEAKPTKDNPIIIQIDEFDIIIHNIHNNVNIQKTDWVYTRIKDKSSLCTFMSEFIPCMPYTIWVFTTNKELAYFNKLDDAYIAPHRVDYSIEL
jgi:hypothetical protein